MSPELASPAALWEAVNQTFAPFAGTCLYAVRAETFFHLAQASADPLRFHLRNLVYRWVLAARRGRSRGERPHGEYLFVCDYAAEPGFGSLRPLLVSCDAPAAIVINASVQAARGKELTAPGVLVIPADVAGQRQQWRSRSRDDYELLQAAAPRLMRGLLLASRRVVRALLQRAYGYEALYREIFASGGWRALITHNDFTSLSYLAGEAARQHDVPDFTLQHGFPSLEYFPTSASHYLVWGAAFEKWMRGRGEDSTTRIAVTGAPRLASLPSCAAAGRGAARARMMRLGLARAGRLNVLFLSQSHSPVFSSEQHRQILTLVSALSAEPWLHLMVRPHPQESRAKRRSWPGASVVPAEISLLEAVLAADIVLSVNSTAMLEAALLRTPVLQIALPGLECSFGVLRFPRQAQDLDQARAELGKLCDQNEREECIAAQQKLVEACVNPVAGGTDLVWSYIRAVCEETSGTKPALAQEAR